MKQTIWSRISLLLLVGVFLVAIAACISLPTSQETPPRALLIGVQDAGSDPYPRLILRPSSTPLARAVANATSGVDTKAVYGTLVATVAAPVSPQYAVEQALVYRIKKENGDTDANNYGWRALNYLYQDAATGYVVNPTYKPATIWATWNSQSKYYAQYEVIPVALTADWTNDLSSATKRTAIRQWLCEWANILTADLGTLDENDYINRNAGNVAALGIALMEISGQTTGTCTLSVTAETRIGQIVAWIKLAFTEAWKNGYYYEQGQHYDDLSIQSLLVFLASAEGAGYLTASADTDAANLLDGLLHQFIPADRWAQWGDVIESDADALDQLHTHYAYLLYVAGNQPEHYWLWHTLRATAAEAYDEWGARPVAGGRPLYLAYFDETIPTATPVARSQFMRDNPDGTPEPVGGIINARDTWDSDSALSINLINRNTYAEHNHYDYSGLEIAYAGQRFIVDHSSDYNDETHGEAVEQNTVVFYDTTVGAWGNLPSNDFDVATNDNASVYGWFDTLADWDASGLVVVSDHTYPLINPLNRYQVTATPASSPTTIVEYLPKATITPAPTGRRAVMLARASDQPAVLAVFDRDSLGSAKDWRVLWNTHNALLRSGNGTTGSPLRLQHNTTGDVLYGFMADGLTMSSYARTYTAGCSNCESALTSQVYYAQRNGTTDAIFSTIWFASPNGPPTITHEVIDGRNTYKIVRPGYTSYARYVQNEAQTDIVVGRVTTDAEAFVVFYNAAGTITNGLFANYTTLKDGSTTIDTGTAKSASIEFGASSYQGLVADVALEQTPVGGALTPTLTPSITYTPSPTVTRTNTPTSTRTPTSTSTRTATATRTITLTPSVTNTPTGTPTIWPTLTATNTSAPTSTPTNSPTATFTVAPTLTPTPTATAAGVANYEPDVVESTTIKYSNPNANFNNELLETIVRPSTGDTVAKVLLQWPDLAKPANTVYVSNAQLKLWLSSGSWTPPLTLHAYRLTTYWEADYATWNTASSYGDWLEVGIGAEDMAGTPALATSVLADDGSFTLDITTIVQDWLDNGYDNYGLVLIAPYGYGSYDLMLYGDLAGAEIRPQLIITLALSATPTITYTPSLTSTPPNTGTPTPTGTRSTPTRTPTPTGTRTPTVTPTVTPTPIPGLKVNEWCNHPTQDMNLDGLQNYEDRALELYNPGATGIDLSGYMLTFGDDTGLVMSYIFPRFTYIWPNNYKVIYSSQLRNPYGQKFTMPGGVSNTTVRLYAPGGLTPLDYVYYYYVGAGLCQARYPNGSNNWIYGVEPSLGKVNVEVRPY